MKLLQPNARPIHCAVFKHEPADFVVTEIMPIEQTGTGEHLWLYLSKINLNTTYVARLLADWAGVLVRDVGYSGLKDRHAITHQWFSVRLPSQTPPAVDFATFAAAHLTDNESLTVTKSIWHNRKLNRGTHKQNAFGIRLRAVKGERDAIERTLTHIAQHGVVNYFGKQRFGRDANNIAKAQAFFDKLLTSNKPYRPNKKFAERDGLMISVARSVLFNAMLTQRVADGTWDTAIAGDVFNLDGTGSIFADSITDDIRLRVRACDIHPTAPLYGIGTRRDCDTAQQCYDTVLDRAELATFRHGLAHIQAKLSYRPLRLMVQDLTWCDDGDDLLINFCLPKGSFATVVLDALVENLISNHHDATDDA
ncbi:tRNA pseudouridine(13) synthase TruD [Moraxella marmotae]|uniref:tRNA pseudouridine(13) synthase TruD n=1 Tax=Moraxella marmotae TaxID=3344520 RepID=UPI0035F49972